MKMAKRFLTLFLTIVMVVTMSTSGTVTAFAAAGNVSGIQVEGENQLDLMAGGITAAYINSSDADGNVITKSDTQKGSELLGKMTDGNNDTFPDSWLVEHEGIILDFGEGHKAALFQVNILARQDQFGERVNGTVIQGSDNGSTWVDITETVTGIASKTVSGSAIQSPWVQLSADSSSAHRYVRIWNRNSNWCMNIAEIEFFGSLESTQEDLSEDEVGELLNIPSLAPAFIVEENPASRVENMFDDSISTSYDNTCDNGIVMDFGKYKSIRVNSAAFMSSLNVSGTILYGSNDGSSWEEVTKEAEATAGLQILEGIRNGNYYRYIKVGNKNRPSGWSFKIQDLKIFGAVKRNAPIAEDTSSETDITADIGSNSGFMTYQNDKNGADGTSLWTSLTDGKITTFADKTGGSLVIDLTDNGRVNASAQVTGINFYARHSWADRLAGSKLLGSNDGTSWVELTAAATAVPVLGVINGVDYESIKVEGSGTFDQLIAAAAANGIADINDSNLWTPCSLLSQDGNDYKYLKIVTASTYLNISEIRIFGHYRYSASEESITPKLMTKKSDFVHPGILNSGEELATMKKYAVGADSCEPWASAFQKLKAETDTYFDSSNTNYLNPNDLSMTRITNLTSGGSGEMRINATKVYNLTIMWYITGDSKYAELAKRTMLWYGDHFEGLGNLKAANSSEWVLSNVNLAVGSIALKFCSAAEILRQYYSGWTKADTYDLLEMFSADGGDGIICSMKTMFERPDSIAQYKVNNMIHGHEIMLNYGTIAYAVFAEDVDLYNKIVTSYVIKGADYEAADEWTKWDVNGAYGGSIFFNVNETTGQYKEADRDQSHTLVGLFGLAEIAQIAYLQGDDTLYECGNRLLLKGAEFLSGYALGYDPEQIYGYQVTYPWNAHNRPFSPSNASAGPSTYNRGFFNGGLFELVYNHYKYHSNATPGEYSKLEETVNNPIIMPEPLALDVTGNGTLLYSNEDRKNVYQNLPVPMTSPDKYTLPAQNNLAVIYGNAIKDNDGAMTVQGNANAVISYPQTELGNKADPTESISMVLSSTTTGWAEIRTQSYNGTKYGQPADFNDSYSKGNTGTLLATIQIPDTNGKTVNVGSLVYTTAGIKGGEVINSQNGNMLFVVIHTDGAGSISYKEIQLRPREDAVIEPAETTGPVDKATGKINLSYASFEFGMNNGQPADTGAGNTGEKLYDNDLSTFANVYEGNGNWSNGDGYILLDFGEKSSVAVSKAKMQERNDDPYCVGRIAGTYLLGSNDKSNWTIITAKLGNNTAAEQETTALEGQSTNYYRYFKLMNDNKGWTGNVAELKLYGDYKTSDTNVKESDATLVSLNYILNGISYPVTGFTPQVNTYLVSLPAGTAEGAGIELQGTANSLKASITTNGTVISEGKAAIRLKVTAEDATVKSYRVIFSIDKAAPPIPGTGTSPAEGGAGTIPSGEDTVKQEEKQLLDEITVTTQNTLFIGGTTGDTFILKVSLPKKLIVAGSTFTSGNKGCVRVDESGRLRAVKEGVAVITTKITLKDGVYKEFTTVVTVKKAFVKFTEYTSDLKMGKSYIFKVSTGGYRKSDLEYVTIRRGVAVVGRNKGKTSVRVYAKSAGSDYVVVKAYGTGGKYVTKKIKVNIKK
ncbi:MAG: hypothetical protein K0S76_1519 [Herbinix sp.]|jgi:hypothetical protein|nr:hypothetical protein [Herbinix sp.]MDF2870040.1 hypothetical protein [Anaerocolumna sp.]